MKYSFSLSLIAFLTSFSSWEAYAVILGVLLACGFGLPLPEDITLVSAGVLSALGTISLPGALLVGFTGVLAGDSILFFLGRKFGHKVFKLPGFKRVFTEHRIRLAEQKVVTNSKFICFTARFLPGLRAPVFLTAGLLGVRPLVFFVLDGMAALISVPTWIVVGWYFGHNIHSALAAVKEVEGYILAGLVVLIVGYVIWKRHRTLLIARKSSTPGES